MAEKPAGSSGARPGASTTGGSRIPRDAFISKLVSDPANVSEPPEVLRGFVGDSDEPGYSRIYCGHGLDAYADVRDEDILHYEPSTDGSEHTLWAKAGAQVKYGQRGGPKSAASGFIDGPLLSDYSGGGTGGGGPIGVTGWLGCGQATHLIGCTGYQGCGQPQTMGLGCPGTSTCPPPSGLGCPRTSTCPPTYAPGCPNTSTCTPEGGAAEGLAAAPLGPTAWLGCVRTSAMGCPNTSTCTPHTHMPGCPNTSTCTPQTHLLGCPNTSTCTPQTHLLGCPNTSTCTPHVTVAQQSTAATLCTRYGCQPGTAATVCTQLCPHPGTMATVCTQLCPNPGTAATVCTQVHCPMPGTYQYACTLGFTCTYVGCP
jgi:hypothetical protein